MKIHIVQKGDTIWEISKKYGVDFDQVKELNPQISSPDMIMPGMKIKIPSTTKQVKQEKIPVKETKHKKETQKPIQPKPIKKIEPIEKEKTKKIEVKPPIEQNPIVPIEPLKEAPKIKEQPIQPKAEPKKETPIIKEKKQPETIPPNTLPELGIQQGPIAQPKVNKETVEQQYCKPVCCCWCNHMHHCGGMAHSQGGFQHMHQGHMFHGNQQMTPIQGHMQGNFAHNRGIPPYRYNEQAIDPNAYYNQQQMYPVQNSIQSPQNVPQEPYQHSQFGKVQQPYGRPFPNEGPHNPIQPLNQDYWEHAHSTERIDEFNEHTNKQAKKPFPQPPIYPAHPRIEDDM